MIREVLKGVRDDLKLGEYEIMPKPLLELVRAYTSFLVTDKDLPAISHETTGHDLKDYIELLDAKRRVQLLHLYIQLAEGDEETKTSEDRIAKEDERFVSKMILQITVAVVIAVFVGFILYVSSTQDLVKLKNSFFDIFNVITQKDKNA